MDAALHAHLGGAELPGLLGPVRELVHRQRVRVSVGAPLRERAEPAAGVADVGEVDVPVDDVGDVAAVDVGPQRIGQCSHRLQLAPPGPPARREPATPAPPPSPTPSACSNASAWASDSSLGSRSAERSAAATSLS